MYRLMFSDLDETLLVNHHVPKMNQEAILKAREQGLKFIPCTGRAFNMIPDILKEIGTYDKAGEYSLCFNGGLIVENKDNKVLHFKGLDFKQAKEIFENARQHSRKIAEEYGTKRFGKRVESCYEKVLLGRECEKNESAVICEESTGRLKKWSGESHGYARRIS